MFTCKHTWSYAMRAFTHLRTYLMLRQKMFGKHCDIMRWVISTVWIGTRHPKSIQIRHPKSVFQHETASRLPAVYTQKTMWPNYVTPCPSDGRAFTPSPTVDICTGANKYVYIYIYVCVSYIYIYIYISLSLSLAISESLKTSIHLFVHSERAFRSPRSQDV